MSTLLMRLAAPLQSWGVDSKFDRRGTERLPTKSGVIGLVAAALGRKRGEVIEDLSALRFGVRVDKDGVLLRDFHTAISKKPYVTNRYYLSDAVFLAGLEGEDAFLSEIDRALRMPVYPLFLGRRSCPPEGRVSLGIRPGKSVYEALKEEPLQASDQILIKAASEVRLRIMVDADEEDNKAFYQRDIPISFSQTHRKFGFRRVSEYPIVVRAAKSDIAGSLGNVSEHDPMSELED